MILTTMMGKVPVGAVIGIAFGAVALGVTLGFVLAKVFFASRLAKSKTTATKMVQDALNEVKTIKKEASREVETLKQEAILKAKEEALETKMAATSELQAKRLELQRSEDRILQKEELLNKKQEQADELKASLEKSKQELEKIKTETEAREAEAVNKLEKAAGMSKEEAKKQLILSIENEAKKEAAVLVKTIENETKETADKKSKEIISLAIQKCASDHTSEVTVSVVALPNDDVKGRIIGREGRNIKALENETGVDLIIDDTPEAITISGFDPIRREVARISLEKLILDGRIHPARIEEIVEKVRKDLDVTMKEAGENAAIDAGVVNLHPEIVKTLGRLKYRTSYGQNVLKHSLEVCHLAGLMAAEIGANVTVAKRGGLLHDLGKAVDFEKEGTHTVLGAELAKKFKESDAVVHCIEAHHGDVPYKSIEAILVQAADAISSSRPGARRESLENYVKRLKKLEEIAGSFKGVEKTYAIQAGREIRIIVKPEEVDDSTAMFMAKDIAKKIEAEMEYPGQIKVNVVRETRNVEYAK